MADWIKCSERMPDGFPMQVQVAYESDSDGKPCLDVGIAMLFPDGLWRGGGVFSNVGGNQKYVYKECVRKVTHWQPLPEPPHE